MAVLTYHSVNPRWGSALSVSPDEFENHCKWLGHKRVEKASTVAQHMVSSRSQRLRPVALTFDDGFADVHEHAWPALRRHGLSATVFVVTATLSGEKDIDWILEEGHPTKTLSAEQVLEMHEAGISFGSHSKRHHDLIDLDEADCERDLRDSKEALEDLLGERVDLLAYPRGLHDDRVRRAAQRAGYAFAFGTSKMLAPPGRYALPRVGVYRGDGRLALALKRSGLHAPIKRVAGRFR